MAETKIIVLDDDPTGIQTVFDIDVLMRFEVEDLLQIMKNPEELVYLSTNSRSLLPDETERLHRHIIQNLSKASRMTGREFLIISRGDSTMRGHYPLESEIIREELESLNYPLRGEILCPYLDGIRKTEDDVHYVLNQGEWIPCAETEFARDATFGYHHSDIKEYVNEKYGTVKSFVSISIDMLDGHHDEEILNLLYSSEKGSKIIVNALNMSHLEAFIKALQPVKHLYQYRTAASFVKAFAKVGDRPFLTMKELCDHSKTGGLILAGSHVKKTTEQIECLLSEKLAEVLVLDVSTEIEPQIQELAEKTDELLSQGKNVLVMTSRTRIDFEGNAFNQLIKSRNISEKFVSLITKCKVRPRFLISKGGITSFDVLNKGLHMSSARVLGQVAKNIPAVRLEKGSLYPGMSVVVFPGNVGESETLKELVKQTVC